MIFGPTTVTFVKVAEDTTNRDEWNNPAETRTQTDVPGCMFRPLTFREQAPVDVDKITERWKCTAPPVAAVLAANGNDELIVDGVTYSIEGGIEVFGDFLGPFKVTIICERQIL